MVILYPLSYCSCNTQAILCNVDILGRVILWFRYFAHSNRTNITKNLKKTKTTKKNIPQAYKLTHKARLYLSINCYPWCMSERWLQRTSLVSIAQFQPTNKKSHNSACMIIRMCAHAQYQKSNAVTEHGGLAVPFLGMLGLFRGVEGSNPRGFHSQGGSMKDMFVLIGGNQ